MSTMTQQTISEQAKSNIDEIELDVTTSSQYFKPRPGTTYMVQVDWTNIKSNQWKIQSSQMRRVNH